MRGLGHELNMRSMRRVANETVLPYPPDFVAIDQGSDLRMFSDVQLNACKVASCGNVVPTRLFLETLLENCPTVGQFSGGAGGVERF